MILKKKINKKWKLILGESVGSRVEGNVYTVFKTETNDLEEAVQLNMINSKRSSVR